MIEKTFLELIRSKLCFDSTIYFHGKETSILSISLSICLHQMRVNRYCSQLINIYHPSSLVFFFTARDLFCHSKSILTYTFDQISFAKIGRSRGSRNQFTCYCIHHNQQQRRIEKQKYFVNTRMKISRNDIRAVILICP